MKFAYGNRASSVLFNWLKANNICGRALIPANICESVPATYLKAGIDIMFCDIDIKSFEPDYLSVKRILFEYPEISVFHYNHTYGCRKGIDNKFLTYIKQNYPNIIIIDDRCLSIPKLYPFECQFDLVLFSTGHTKVVNIGKGGFAYYKDCWSYKEADDIYISNNEIIFDKHVKDCHLNGGNVNIDIMKSDWINTVCQYNEKEYCNEVKNKFNESIEHKKKLNKIYDMFLSDYSLGENYQDWRYNIIVDNQDYCLEQLFKNGLFASKHYKSLGSGYFVSSEFGNCDWLESHVINLFNDFCYTEEQTVQTAKLLKSIAKPLNAKL